MGGAVSRMVTAPQLQASSVGSTGTSVARIKKRAGLAAHIEVGSLLPAPMRTCVWDRLPGSGDDIAVRACRQGIEGRCYAAVCSRQMPDIRPRSQRWAGSTSRRGCHICEIVITPVWTGRGKLLSREAPDPASPDWVAWKKERVTSATRSDAPATASAARNPGTTATTVRTSPRSASALSTGRPQGRGVRRRHGRKLHNAPR